MKGGARPGSGRKPTNFDYNRARKLKQEGFTYVEIANRFGVTLGAIQWFFKKENKRNQLERMESVREGDRRSVEATQPKAKEIN